VKPAQRKARRRGLLIGVALGLSAALGVLVWQRSVQPPASPTARVQQKVSPSTPLTTPQKMLPLSGVGATEAAPNPENPSAPSPALTPSPVPSDPTALLTPLPTPPKGEFAERIARMTPEERVAQQMFSYVPADVKAARALLNIGLGGVFVNRSQGPRLEDYHTFLKALSSAARVPPLVGIDQEGGNVARVRDVEMQFPPNATLGALEPKLALEKVQHQGQTFGTRLKAAGFSVDFAPVIDVATNARGRVIAALGRAYSSDPEEVSTLGRAFALELQGAGLAPTFKHFPGHGMVIGDSHKEVARSRLSRSQLEPHLAPYRALLTDPALRQDQMLIMTANVLYPALDARNPASLSRAITTDLLRGELKYQGVVLTDALGMKALSGTLYSRVSRALSAGADLALIDPGLEREVPGVVRGLAFDWGADPVRWRQNADSLERIFRLKRALGLLEPDPKGTL